VCVCEFVVCFVLCLCLFVCVCLCVCVENRTTVVIYLHHGAESLRS